MKMRVLQQTKLIVPFLLVAFLACGGGSFFCPMGTEAAPHHSQENSHPSPGTPLNSSEDCPDQLKSSEELSKNLTYGVSAFTEVAVSIDIFKSPFSEYFFASAVPTSSTYPLLFLLFSVFLN